MKKKTSTYRKQEVQEIHKSLHRGRNKLQRNSKYAIDSNATDTEQAFITQARISRSKDPLTP